MASGGLALSFGRPRPACCRDGFLAPPTTAFYTRRALQHRQRSPSQLKELPRLSVSCASSSFPADAQEVVENAVARLSGDEKSPKWAKNQKDLRSLLHNTWCTVRKKLWVAALAMFYLYNEAAEKLPWLKIKRFEAWFWKKVRCTWLPAASAATVLARQYFSDASKGMWFTPGNLLRRKDVLEAEVKEDVEQVTQGLEENLEEQSAAVQQRLPDAVNPLLLGQHLKERLDAGALDLPTFEAAMAEVKHMVPFLDAGKEGEAVEAELEAQTKDGEREAEASHDHVAGFLNLPLGSSLGGPQPPHEGTQADGRAAVAEAKQEVEDGEGPGWPVLGSLGSFVGGLTGASKEQAAVAAAKGKAAEERAEEQTSWGFLPKGLFGSEASAAKAKAAAAQARAAEERDKGFSWALLKSPFSSEEKPAVEAAEESAARGDDKGWKGLHLPFLGQSVEEAQTEAAEEEAEEDRGFVMGFLKQNLLGQSSEEAEREACLAKEEAAAAKEQEPEGGFLGLLLHGKRTPDSGKTAAEAAEEKEEEDEAKGLLSKVLNLGQ